MKEKIKYIYQLLTVGLYDTEYAFVPFGISRTVHRPFGYNAIGWSSYRIFGIRIAKIQETRPWEKK